MLTEGMVSKRAEFYSPDGVRYSQTSKLSEIMQLPFFRLRVDEGAREYHVHSSRAFNMSLTVATPGERKL